MLFTKMKNGTKWYNKGRNGLIQND